MQPSHSVRQTDSRAGRPLLAASSKYRRPRTVVIAAATTTTCYRAHRFGGAARFTGRRFRNHLGPRSPLPTTTVDAHHHDRYGTAGTPVSPRPSRPAVYRSLSMAFCRYLRSGSRNPRLFSAECSTRRLPRPMSTLVSVTVAFATNCSRVQSVVTFLNCRCTLSP